MTIQQFFQWTPRILGILLVAFITLFAFDAFSNGEPASQNISDFLTHLIPAAIALVMVLTGWFYPLVGGFLFITLALSYSYISLDHPNWILTIGLPLFVLGALFIASHFIQRYKQ